MNKLPLESARCEYLQLLLGLCIFPKKTLKTTLTSCTCGGVHQGGEGGITHGFARASAAPFLHRLLVLRGACLERGHPRLRLASSSYAPQARRCGQTSALRYCRLLGEVPRRFSWPREVVAEPFMPVHLIAASVLAQILTGA